MQKSNFNDRWAPVVTVVGLLTLLVNFFILIKGNKTFATFAFLLLALGGIIVALRECAFALSDKPMVGFQPKYKYHQAAKVGLGLAIGLLLFLIFYILTFLEIIPYSIDVVAIGTPTQTATPSPTTISSPTSTLAPTMTATVQPVLEKIIWSFQTGTEGWQAERQTSDRPEFGLANVSWDSPTLRADFDFSPLDPALLPAGLEPRAAFFVKDFHENWGSFLTLKIEAVNLTPYDMKLTFTVFVGNNLWHEYGEFQNLPPEQNAVLSFDLNAHNYKTFYASNSYDNSHVVFDDVNRFDLIVSTNEANWNKVKGAIRIHKIWLSSSSAP